MIKKTSVLVLILLSTTIFANIESKIDKTKENIKRQKAQQEIISQKLDDIAKKISKEEQRLKKINRDILSIKQEIKRQNKKTKIKRGELKKIDNLYNELLKREKVVNKKMIDIISKGVSLDMISATDESNQNSFYEKSIDAIVMKEIYSSYTKILKDKFASTKKRYDKLRKNIKIVKKELDKLKFKLNDLRSKIKKYDKLKALKSKSVKNLELQKSSYLKKLNIIKKERKELDSTLKKLNITKKERERTVIKATPNLSEDVRQIGSSYQTSALIKYRGPKTIAPLDEYTVAQNFGTYIDPIYKMKIFNESVILRAKSKNARVKNVLDGKVIYANKTAMLEYIVIVKNRDNIHTIFAHLSQIAPTIKVGKKIPKGYILGRVNRELTFEVTQNDKHINPLRLIK